MVDDVMMKWATANPKMKRLAKSLTLKYSRPSINDFITRSFPTDEAACNGSPSSRPKLIGYPCQEGILDAPRMSRILPFAAAEWRPR